MGREERREEMKREEKGAGVASRQRSHLGAQYSRQASSAIRGTRAWQTRVRTLTAIGPGWSIHSQWQRADPPGSLWQRLAAPRQARAGPFRCTCTARVFISVFRARWISALLLRTVNPPGSNHRDSGETTHSSGGQAGPPSDRTPRTDQCEAIDNGYSTRAKIGAGGGEESSSRCDLAVPPLAACRRRPDQRRRWLPGRGHCPTHHIQ